MLVIWPMISCTPILSFILPQDWLWIELFAGKKSYHSCYMPHYILDVADIWVRRGYNYSDFYQIYLIQYKIYVVLGMRLEMLVFWVVLLVSWFNYVNAGRTSEMRVTWEVCNVCLNSAMVFLVIGGYQWFSVWLLVTLRTIFMAPSMSKPSSLFSSTGSLLVAIPQQLLSLLCSQHTWCARVRAYLRHQVVTTFTHRIACTY